MRRLDQEQPKLAELGDGEIALVRLAQANGEIGLPAREFDVLAGSEKPQGDARIGHQQRGGARRQNFLRDRIGGGDPELAASPGRLSPILPMSATCAAIAWTWASTVSHCAVGLRKPSIASNSLTPSARSMRCRRRPTVVSSMRKRALAPA